MHRQLQRREAEVERASEERRKRKRALLQEEERLMNKLDVRRRMIFTEIIARKASFLVSSMAQIFAIYIYIFQADRRSVNVLNVSTYVYLNIRPMQYSFFAMQI